MRRSHSARLMARRPLAHGLWRTAYGCRAHWRMRGKRLPGVRTCSGTHPATCPHDRKAGRLGSPGPPARCTCPALPVSECVDPGSGVGRSAAGIAALVIEVCETQGDAAQARQPAVDRFTGRPVEVIVGGDEVLIDVA